MLLSSYTMAVRTKRDFYIIPNVDLDLSGKS